MDALRKTRKVSEKRKQQLLGILKAMAGKPCPTNAMLADIMGYESPSAVGALLTDLYNRNIVRNVSRDRRRRQLQIVTTGETTAPSNEPRA